MWLEIVQFDKKKLLLEIIFYKVIDLIYKINVLGNAFFVWRILDRCVINIIWYSIDVFVNLWCRELRKNSLQTNTGQCTYWPIVQLRVYR